MNWLLIEFVSQVKHKKSSIGGLVITRREREKIAVNHGEIIIEVVEIRGNEVKLAFSASREIRFDRVDKGSTLDQVSYARDAAKK